MSDAVDLSEMSVFVAQAVHRAAIGNDDEVWDDLTAEEQADFLLIAHAAMGAHDGWLSTHGFTIAKLNRAKRRALLTPDRPKLIRPN